MDTKTINWKEEFIKLFPESTNRTLKNNYKWCDKCNSLGFIRKGEYISFCNDCRGNGQIELCTEGCGRDKKLYCNTCETCLDKSDTEKRIKFEKERFNKAQKILFKDYEGKFLINDRVMNKEDFAEYLYDKITDGDNYLNYEYGTKKELIMSIDFTDVIANACDDGYEDMTDHLDYNGVEEIQLLIDKWVEKQGESNYSYWETSKVVVLLDDLITEIKEQISNKNNK